jgi:hypothetical protein
MLTIEEVQKYNLDGFDIPDIEDITRDTEYYGIGIMLRYNGEIYTPSEFESLKQEVEQKYKEDIAKNYSESDVEDEVERLIQKTFNTNTVEAYASIFFSDEIHDRYIVDKYHFEFSDYKSLFFDDTREEHVYLISKEFYDFENVIDGLENYFRTI